jgi:hypothetical protein
MFISADPASFDEALLLILTYNNNIVASQFRLVPALLELLGRFCSFTSAALPDI